jgi:hypothetical protein
MFATPAAEADCDMGGCAKDVLSWRLSTGDCDRKENCGPEGKAVDIPAPSGSFAIDGEEG